MIREVGAAASLRSSSIRVWVGVSGTLGERPTISNETRILPGGGGVFVNSEINSREFLMERGGWKSVTCLNHLSRYLANR